MRLPTPDSATGRGIRTSFQAFAGICTGFLITVWGVPGVPAAVEHYVVNNLPQVLLLAGLPAGIISFLQNVLREDVPNY